MAHKYIVDLTVDEQEYLLNLIKKGKPYSLATLPVKRNPLPLLSYSQGWWLRKQPGQPR
jgi:hypothetical protein